jgi:hypothetical protein
MPQQVPAFQVSERVHARVGLLLRRVRAAAVEIEHQRGLFLQVWRHVDEIVALDAADPDVEAVIPGCERECLCCEKDYK